MPTEIRSRRPSAAAALCFFAVGGLVAACSGSSPRDQWYGSDAGAGFDAPGTGGAGVDAGSGGAGGSGSGGIGGGGGETAGAGTGGSGSGGEGTAGMTGMAGTAGTDAAVNEQDTGP